MIEKRNFKIDHKLKAKIDDLVYHMHEYDLDLKSNHIYLMGIDRGYDTGDGLDEPGVEFTIANRFIRNFNLCMRVNPNTPIIIHQKTNGGYWEEGMAIYDTIRSCPWPVTILNYTHARSMSSLIFQAGNKRVMMPNSHFMFHEGSLIISGTNKAVKSAVEFDKNADQTMLEIYSKSMKTSGKFKNKKESEIKAWLNSQMDKKEDVYLTATETVDLGLADEIFDYDWSKLASYTEEQLTR